MKKQAIDPFILNTINEIAFALGVHAVGTERPDGDVIEVISSLDKFALTVRKDAARGVLQIASSAPKGNYTKEFEIKPYPYQADPIAPDTASESLKYDHLQYLLMFCRVLKASELPAFKKLLDNYGDIRVSAAKNSEMDKLFNIEWEPDRPDIEKRRRVFGKNADYV